MLWMSVYIQCLMVSLCWMSVYILYVGVMDECLAFILVWLQVDGTGGCLFSAIKKSLLAHTATVQEATYFPNWYFRRMVVNYMVNHRQLIFENKYLALMSLYGIEEQVDQDRDWNPPLSFKQYLRLMLWQDFWGDKVDLHAISCMWLMKITVLNMRTLQEYRTHHNRRLDDTDVVVTFNAVNHFNTTGGWTSV